MKARYILGAYWSSRRESMEECAKRLGKLVIEMADIDPALATWYEPAPSRNRALQVAVDLRDQDRLLKMLVQGRNRRDANGKVMEELRSNIGLWNGGVSGKNASLSITCGLSHEPCDPNVSLQNCVVINLPSDLGELRNGDQMSRLLAVVARVWEPDWAGVMSRDSMNARNFNATTPFVDWMLYVPNAVPAPAPPSSVIRLPELGSIVVVQPTPPSIEDTEISARRRRVDHLFQRTAA